MAVSTYKAQLNYYDSSYGWGNEGTASQGSWTGTGTRTGVMYFPGLSALKGKIINKVTFKTTNLPSGNNQSKTAYFYRSANQGGIKTSLNANHKTGSSIGSLTTNFHSYTNETSSLTAAFFAQYIANGEDTFCIYTTGTANYLKWSAVTLEIDWSEPATKPTLSKSSVAMGSAVTISTSASNSAYRHTLRYAFWKATGTIASDVSTSYSWTPPVSLAQQIPAAASGSGTIYCDTYSGSTLLGTKSVAITLTVPASVVPSAGTLSASVAEDTSGTGTYVKGMGKARVRLTGASGAQGSTIQSTKITGGGWTENDADLTTGILTTAGTIKFTATVTDTRGRTATATCSITVLDYAKPKITSCLIYRCDSTGAKKNNGTYVAIEIDASYSPISGNSMELTAAYKLSSDSDYGAETEIINNGKTVIGGDLSASSTYSVRVTVSDQYNTVPVVNVLSTRFVALSVLKNLGVAIGKVAELAGVFEIALKTKFTGGILPVVLESGTDMDDVLTPNHYAGLNASGSNYRNCPLSSGTFSLDVIGQGNEGQVKQVISECRKTAPLVYERTYSSGSWGAWQPVLTNARLQNIFGKEYTLTTNAVPGANYSSAEGSAYLIGNILRCYIHAQRASASTSGNITNEEVCTFEITHNGKIKFLYGVSFVNGGTGPVASFYVGDQTINENTLTFKVYLTATESALTETSADFAPPVLLNIDAY